MERRTINPWTWQDQYGYVQANEVIGASRTLVCAGQTAIDAGGNLAHAGDIGAQLELALDNLEAVLEQADFSLADVVRLNVYTTDVDALFSVWPTLVTRLQEGNCRAAMTLLGVARLAFPELLVEIEATAMK